jgi:hypothetical protein
MLPEKGFDDAMRVVCRKGLERGSANGSSFALAPVRNPRVLDMNLGVPITSSNSTLIPDALS